MSSSAVLSDNTRQQADDRQAAILKNISASSYGIKLV